MAIAAVASYVSYAANSTLCGMEKVKHSTTDLQHVCKIFNDMVVILEVQAKWATKMVGFSSKGILMIDAFGIISPIQHFVINQSYQTATKANNIFMAGILICSTFDLSTFLKEANAVDLGKYVQNLGERFPVLGSLKNFPVDSFVSYTVIFMFAAHAKDAWDEFCTAPKDREDLRKAAMFTVLYSTGTVAVNALRLMSANPVALVGLNCAVQAIGITGTFFKSKNPQE